MTTPNNQPIEQRQEWTRIDDADPNSIPQKLGYYIVACEGGNVDTSFFSPDVDFFRGKAPSRKSVGKHSRCFELSQMGYRIVAWMPKPQAPEYALK